MPFNSTTFKMHPITGGNPDNDTDALGGTLNTGAEWTAGVDFFFEAAAIPAASETVRYGLAGWAVASGVSETLTSPKMSLRSGMEKNASQGQLGAVSTYGSDTGTLRILCSVGGSYQIVELELAGTTTVYTTEVIEAESILWVEYIVGSSATVPTGNITLSVAAQTIGVMFGTSSGHGVYQLNSLMELALADALNVAIDWSGTNNRLTEPDTNIGAFSNAVEWDGNVASIALPADLTAEDEIQFCVKMTFPADLQLPAASGNILVKVSVTGIEES